MRSESRVMSTKRIHTTLVMRIVMMRGKPDTTLPAPELCRLRARRGDMDCAKSLQEPPGDRNPRIIGKERGLIPGNRARPGGFVPERNEVRLLHGNLFSQAVSPKAASPKADVVDERRLDPKLQDLLRRQRERFPAILDAGSYKRL